MRTEYAVIITKDNGEKQVCRFGLNGRKMYTSTAAIDLIDSFNDLFPGYKYDWAPVRPRAEV